MLTIAFIVSYRGAFSPSNSTSISGQPYSSSLNFINVDLSFLWLSLRFFSYFT